MRRLISRYSHATNVQFSVLCRHRSTEKLDSSCQCGVVRSRCPHGLLAVGYGIESGTGSLGVRTALGVHVVAYVSRWCRVTVECTRLGCSIWLNTFSRSRASDGNTSQTARGLLASFTQTVNDVCSTSRPHRLLASMRHLVCRCSEQRLVC